MFLLPPGLIPLFVSMCEIVTFACVCLPPGLVPEIMILCIKPNIPQKARFTIEDPAKVDFSPGGLRPRIPNRSAFSLPRNGHFTATTGVLAGSLIVNLFFLGSIFWLRIKHLVFTAFLDPWKSSDWVQKFNMNPARP